MKKIVWDWNGTLFDDLDLCFHCINRLLKQYGLEELKDIQAYRNVFQFPIQTYYQNVGFDFKKVPYEILANQYMEDYQSKSHNCNLFKDVLPALKKGKEKGISQVILSASRKDFLTEQINMFPIRSFLDAIYGIENIYAKTKVQLAYQCKQEYPQDELWFVGDSIHDYEVAQRVGAKCVLLTSGHQSKDALKTTGQPVLDHAYQAMEYIYEAD